MLETLKVLFPLGDSKWQEYARCFQRLAVPARTTLLREGEVSRRGYFVEQGCLRVWFNRQGKDLTFQFFFEGQTVSSLDSFRTHRPSLFSIETIEPCVLWWVARDDAYRMLAELSEHPAARDWLAGLLFERVEHYMAHCLAFIRDTPRQRYHNLLAHEPHIVRRVPQHYIASYLGISSVHLSRLKAAG